jgi:hypothetical protein
MQLLKILTNRTSLLYGTPSGAVLETHTKSPDAKKKGMFLNGRS